MIKKEEEEEKMSYWNAKYKNEYGEYEITFGSGDRELTRVVEKVCQAIIDNKINTQNAAAVLDRLIKMDEAVLKVGEWIPCSERLPEMSGSYLCCWKADDDPRITMSVLNFDGEGFPWERVNYHSNTRVLAWMPLPEPYREDGV